MFYMQGCSAYILIYIIFFFCNISSYIQAVIFILVGVQSKGAFSQSHYYLALYRFKAIEKDDLDFQ